MCSSDPNEYNLQAKPRYEYNLKKTKQLMEWLEQLKEYQTSELLGHLVKIPSEAYVIYRGHVLKCDVYEVTYCAHRKPYFI